MNNTHVNLFYNGHFEQCDNIWEYVNGKVVKLENFVIGHKYYELVQMIEEKLELNDFFKLFYRGVTGNFANIYCDESVNEMIVTRKNDGVIDVYVEHVVVSEENDHSKNIVVNADAVLEEKESDEDNSVETIDSEYFDSSECGSFFDSDDEDMSEHAMRKKSRFIGHDASSELAHFSVNMIFSGVEEFRTAVKNYAIKQAKDIKFKKNESERVRVVCKWPGCPWVLYALLHKQTGHFMVKTFNPEHECLHSFKCSYVTAPFLANKYEARILSQPGWKIEEMRSTIQHEMSVSVSRSQCKRAKIIVMKKKFGSYKEEYSRIWDYAEALYKSNEDSTIRVNVNRLEDTDEPRFRRMYICFGACKKGFLGGCRQVIGLDGCFSKGPMKFEILSAIGRDANNQMYPIAWAVVDVENTENWKWFIELLSQDLNIGSGDGWTLISDQQKGLEKCIKLYLPRAEHRMCARHIYSNWNKKHKGDFLKKYFWRCAWSYSRSQFEENLDIIRSKSEEAVTNLLKTDPKHWSRAFFHDDVKCDIVDNNLCESFNKWILDARHKPIITMLEQIRCMVMTRIAKLALEGDKYVHEICPKIVLKMNNNIKAMKDCKMQWNGSKCNEVIHMMQNEQTEIREYKYVVDMENSSCTCRAWNVSGIPCPHAVCAIFHMNKQPNDFVVSWYTKRLHQMTYSHFLQPVVGQHDWPKTRYDRPLPLIQKKMPGRPKKNKRREEGVVPKPNSRTTARTGQIITCGVCRKQGHNKATCPNNIKGNDKTRKMDLKRGRQT